MANKNYYEILGVEKTATEEDIKTSYRKLAKQYHPDLHPNDTTCAAKFKDVNEAYQTLSDSKKRATYDAEQAGGFGGFGGFGGSSGGFEGGFGGFGDDIMNIFNMFTGGGGGRTQRERSRGNDIKINLTLTFTEAAKGVAKDITINKNEQCVYCGGTGAKDGKAYNKCTKCNGTGQYQYVSESRFARTVNVRQCDACNGTGKIITEKCTVCSGKGSTKQQKTLHVDIPSGIETGNVLRYRGEGDACPTADGESGDLLINLSVQAHPMLKRKGMDLFVEIPVSFFLATTGGKVEVPGIDGIISYAIPEGTQSGQVFYIRGKGIKSKQGTGDLYLTIIVEVPKSLSAKQKDLLKSFVQSFESRQMPKSKEYNDILENTYKK